MPTSSITPDQRARLLADLQQRRQRLSGQLAGHLHGQSAAERAADVAAQDADDAPQRAPERAIAMALTDHERRELDAVSAALHRFERGGYGVCVDCGEAIGYARLQAEPWAARCIRCATAAEQAAR